MRAYIANTDYDWYRFFLDRPEIDELNFWRPGTQRFAALSPGEPFLFRLKSPHNAIAGAAFFVHYSVLPASIAWSTFHEKNGAPSEDAMRTRIETYRRRFKLPIDHAQDYSIGCIILTDPLFLPEGQWVREPGNWGSQTVAGRTEALEDGEGQRIWSEIVARLKGLRVSEATVVAGERYGREAVVRPRLGQGGFRVLVTDTYERRCALTGERTLPVLQAAHIRPYARGGAHAISNGLLLRSDLHTLFDRGYVTVTPSYQLEVSRRIREEFENGRDYYALHGREIRLPHSDDLHPEPALLQWHNTNVFKA